MRFLDQTLLPAEERYVDTRDYAVIGEAIRRLQVRGAPLIGIAAAYGLALAARAGLDLSHAASELQSTRPTAGNLEWALGSVLRAALSAADPAAAAEREALRIHAAQMAADVRMGELGASLFGERQTLLTHCNTGSLATGGTGTALGVVKAARQQGKLEHVIVDETRPLLQGARLTAWELERASIPYRLIVDGAAAGLIARGEVDAVIVGADRIAANGDVANKVGTYGLALAARAHAVPFYVAAPASTFDGASADGAQIVIEERGEDEVLLIGGRGVAPTGARALNPAFDVTPAKLISAIITERGVLRAPFGPAIAQAVTPLAVLR